LYCHYCTEPGARYGVYLERTPIPGLPNGPLELYGESFNGTALSIYDLPGLFNVNGGRTYVALRHFRAAPSVPTLYDYYILAHSSPGNFNFSFLTWIL